MCLLYLFNFEQQHQTAASASASTSNKKCTAEIDVETRQLLLLQQKQFQPPPPPGTWLFWRNTTSDFVRFVVSFLLFVLHHLFLVRFFVHYLHSHIVASWSQQQQKYLSVVGLISSLSQFAPCFCTSIHPSIHLSVFIAFNQVSQFQTFTKSVPSLINKCTLLLLLLLLLVAICVSGALIFSTHHHHHCQPVCPFS